MHEARVGQIAQAVRRRLRLRQADVARRAGIDRSTVSLLERGEGERLTLGTIRRCLGAIDVRLDLRATWHGPELDRLLDEDHAALQAAWAARLRRWRWQVWTEVSYSRYGERGRVDLLAWHPTHGFLLVAEVKTTLADAQEALGTLDAKARLGPFLAHQLSLPQPRAVVPAFVFREGMTTRRRLQRLEPLFARFEMRGAAAISWLRRPSAPAPGGLLIFSGANQGRTRGPGWRRVRPQRGPASVEEGSTAAPPPGQASTAAVIRA
jgi:transcriptional regulator with XRE-family HTH domain